LSAALASTGLTREQLVDFAVLLGTDFNPDGFQGVGPATALKYLKKYGRLEEIRELREPLQSVDYQGIRKLYLNPPVEKGVHPQWNSMDRERIISFLVGEHSFSRDRVEAAIARIQASKPAQSETLEKWFG